MLKRLTISAILFHCCATILCSAEDGNLDKVSLQLKWRHQFQFAGYYAAIEQGYYQEEGLEVELLEPDAGQNTYDLVLSGAAEFGVSNSAIVERCANGDPLVQLAVIYQHSPLCLLSLQGKEIENLHDLAGKTVMIEPSSADLLALFQNEGIPLDSMNILTHGFSEDPLIKGEVQAISGYSSDEPFAVRARGYEPIIFSPVTYGIDFYGDGLFTTRQQLEKYPERVAAFRRASLKGWEYALKNPEAVVDLILEQYSQRKSREALLYEAQKTTNLVQADLVPVGYMNPGRWDYIINTFRDVGMIDAPIRAEDFLYQTDPHFPWKKVILILLGLTLLTALCGWLAWYFYRSKLNLEAALQARDTADKALRQSEQFFRHLYESAPLPIVYWNRDAKILHWNSSAEKVFGWKAEEVLGQSYYDIFIPDDEQSHVEEVVQELNHTHTNRASNWNLRKDGSRIWCQWFNVIKCDDDGNLLEGQSIAIDATGQYEREQHLLSKKELAELANETKGEFLASVSHEIRNPLGAIVSLAGLLQVDAQTDDTREMATTIANCGESLIRMLNDLIDHEKLEAGFIELIPARIQLTESIEKTVELFKPSAQEKNITLRAESDCPEIEVTIDTLRLQQIINNLLSNAIKFTSDGEVTVRLSHEADADLPIVIHVEDSGIGIDAEALESIFNLYDQGHEERTRTFGGSGVGLSVCQKLVHLMGGKISVTSQKGKGSTFTVRLHKELPKQS